MLWLGVAACAPQVRIAWSTWPDVGAVDWTYAVTPSPEAPEVEAALRDFISRSGRLREGCDEGATAVVTIDGLRTEQRVDTDAPKARAVRLELPPDLAAAGQPGAWGDVSTPDATAVLQGRVHVSWTVRRCDSAPVDVVEAVTDATVAGSWMATGPAVDAARAGLPDDEGLWELRRAAGYALARRFVPVSGSVARRWFRSGEPRLRLAAAAVRVGHWDAAAATWHELAADATATPAARARAWHDLAVQHEVHGRYALAMAAVRKAERTAAATPILRYRMALQQSWTEHRLLRPYDPLEPDTGEAP